MSTATHRDVSRIHADAVMVQRTPTVHPTAAAVDEYPADIAVTDGGVLIHIGEATVDLTTGSSDPDDIHANLIRAQTVVRALRDAAGGDAALLARLREAAGARSHDAIPHLTEALVDGLAEAMREYDAVRNAGRRRMPSSPPKTPAKTPEKTPVKQQRPPVVGAGWQPAAVDDLAEGDRVRLDVDGSPTEVVLTAPPAESVDDDQTIELEWRADDGREGVAAVGSDEAVFSPNSCCEALSRGPLRVLGGSGHQLVDDQRPCGDRRGDPRVPEVGEPSHRPSRRHENHGERDIVPLGDRREEEAAYHRRHDPEDCLRP